MNIHKTTVPIVVLKHEEILHLGNWYIRSHYSDGTFLWTTMHPGGYGTMSPDELEKVYQELVDKPVETTNEQLEMCACGRHTEEYCLDFCPE